MNKTTEYLRLRRSMKSSSLFSRKWRALVIASKKPDTMPSPLFSTSPNLSSCSLVGRSSRS
ncbi:hypothetical protein BpHYR1_047108 [Brachionus plicatilis]|uniref:Uncharacterized protein n=1 Tax=Brachionus plicatilis TaxID=10195 RepID=A0A3M7Q208_BRAPC|nr:hypothetical protein BpHYR1_047108 [Brachionus plicatilis]